VRQEVRSRSVPTAALLDQQAAIDRWESDGAVVIRIGKAFKETFEKAGQRKKVLSEAIVAVFGAGAFPRLEVGDPKTAGASSPRASASPAPRVAPAPGASTTGAVPVARPAPPPPPGDDVPMPDGPPDWLEDLEASRPEPDGADPAASSPAKPKAAPADGAGAAIEDSAVKLAVDLFNGRVVTASEEA
jgi:hypothetical protein